MRINTSLLQSWIAFEVRDKVPMLVPLVKFTDGKIAHRWTIRGLKILGGSFLFRSFGSIIFLMGAFSRNKGARLERDAATWLEEVTGIKFRRALDQYQASSGKDLEGDSPLVVQVKGGKSPRIWQAYAEAEGEAKSGEVPIALIKRDRYPWLVVLNREDYAPMLAAWLRERKREDERSEAQKVSA
tara:strand:+ start:141 stop:695 length:555 start_codon:yes stop_codon:yes gene_type:complete